MTFNDIFKSSFLEQVSAFSFTDMVISLGAGMIPLAVFGSLIVGAVFVGMNHYKDDAVPYMLVLQCEDDVAEKEALGSLSNSVKRYAVKSKTVSERGVEDTIEVRIAQTSTSFVNELRSVHGVRAAAKASIRPGCRPADPAGGPVRPWPGFLRGIPLCSGAESPDGGAPDPLAG